MVRKWSYLGNVFSSNVEQDFGYCKSLFNFRVFKKTTRFKKAQNTNITHMFRKKYSNRKHKTNWLNLSYLTFEWSLFFLKNKQFLRFYQNLGLFKYHVTSPSIHYIVSRTSEISSLKYVNTFACSKGILSFAKKNYKDVRYNFFYAKYDKPSGYLTSEIENSEDIPGNVLNDNLMYSCFDKNMNTSHSNYEFIFTDLLRSNSNFAISNVVCLYKVNILLTLHILSLKS